MAITETESRLLKRSLVTTYLNWILQIGKTAVIEYATHYPDNIVAESDVLNSISKLELTSSHHYRFFGDNILIIHVHYNHHYYEQHLNLESVTAISVKEFGKNNVVEFEVDTPGVKELLKDLKRERQWPGDKSRVSPKHVPTVCTASAAVQVRDSEVVVSMESFRTNGRTSKVPHPQKPTQSHEEEK